MVSSGLLRRVALVRTDGVTTQKTPYFIVTAVKTSNLTYLSSSHMSTDKSNALQCGGQRGK
jgi:hypothetical protein